MQNMTLDMFGAKNAHLKGIHYLRDVADADGLVAYMKEAKKVSKKAVMVGGGYIGLEGTFKCYMFDLFIKHMSFVLGQMCTSPE
jgi:NAD(P)H-nitrite reductase large subunit